MPAANTNPPSPAPAKSGVVANPPPKPAGYLLAMRVAFISGAFCIVLALSMVANWVHYQKVKPLDAPTIAASKALLIKSPQNEQLKEEIRREDLRLRTAHTRYLDFARHGTWLLVGGMVVFLVGVQSATWRRKLCVIKQPKPVGAEYRGILQASVAVGVLMALFATGTLWLAHSSGTELNPNLLKPSASTPEPKPTATISLPSAEEFRRNWARFRGSDGCGVSSETNAPIQWDTKTGMNVFWKVPVPVPGFNSPIIWGERLFISGGNATNHGVYCFDTKTGALLWEKPVQLPAPAGVEEQEIPEMTGIAASTIATDGRRVYAIFANGDLAAFKLDGTPAWSKCLAPILNQHGHAASLLTWQDRLILQLDQGEAEERKSKLYAFDGPTGKVVWQTVRALPSSWASPILIEAAGKPQIITLGIPFVISYNANDGKELWRVEGLANEVTPSPVFAAGMVFAISPSEKMMAIRPDGQGDVTKTHVAWTVDEGIPDVTSPVSNGELMFLVNSGGLLTCYDVKTGKKLWEHDFELEVQASPTIVGDRLYILGAKGAAMVCQAGREFKELARSQMEDKFYASPAFVQGRIYLRGVKQLYCIGKKGDTTTAQK